MDLIKYNKRGSLMRFIEGRKEEIKNIKYFNLLDEYLIEDIIYKEFNLLNIFKDTQFILYKNELLNKNLEYFKINYLVNKSIFYIKVKDELIDNKGSSKNYLETLYKRIYKMEFQEFTNYIERHSIRQAFIDPLICNYDLIKYGDLEMITLIIIYTSILKIRKIYLNMKDLEDYIRLTFNYEYIFQDSEFNHIYINE